MTPIHPLSRADIERVVAAFYQEIRSDEQLGAVFSRHVRDWPAHEAKIARFWRNAILRERVFDGNPMATHRNAGDVTADQFPSWLKLFDQVLDRELPKDVARAWSALAHRIGQSLRIGLDMAEHGAPPKF